MKKPIILANRFVYKTKKSDLIALGFVSVIGLVCFITSFFVPQDDFLAPLFCGLGVFFILFGIAMIVFHIVWDKRRQNRKDCPTITLENQNTLRFYLKNKFVETDMSNLKAVKATNRKSIKANLFTYDIITNSDGKLKITLKNGTKILLPEVKDVQDAAKLLNKIQSDPLNAVAEIIEPDRFKTE